MSSEFFMGIILGVCAGFLLGIFLLLLVVYLVVTFPEDDMNQLNEY